MQSDILKARSLSKKGEYNNGTARLTGGYSATPMSEHLTVGH